MKRKGFLTVSVDKFKTFSGNSLSAGSSLPNVRKHVLSSVKTQPLYVLLQLYLLLQHFYSIFIPGKYTGNHYL